MARYISRAVFLVVVLCVCGRQVAWGWMWSGRKYVMAKALKEQERKRRLMELALKKAECKEALEACASGKVNKKVRTKRKKGLEKKAMHNKKGGLYWDVQVSGGHIEGNSTYHIAFDGGASELEFPLDTDLAGVGIELSYFNDVSENNLPKAKLYCRLWSDVSHNGVLKDSDWMENDNQPGLDVYSEGKTRIDLFLLDARYLYNFYIKKHFSIGVLTGYRYQNFDYRVYDVNQIGYGIYASAYTTSQEGLVARYWVKSQIPYFGFELSCSLSRFLEITAVVGASPWVKIKDMDDHILRYKRCTGRTEGHSYFAKVSADICLTRRVLVLLNMEYWDIETSGEQYQYWYGGSSLGSSAVVSDMINSSYWLGNIALVYRF